MMKKYSLTIWAVTALSTANTAQTQSVTELHHTSLQADGPTTGHSAYALIRKAFGTRAIESPDLYRGNHADVVHITEDTDEIVGPHFVFLAHRDHDNDRDKGLTDRQRNEIKAYDKSKRALKGYEGETMQYRWKFKIDSDFEFSKSFTHFFQIKAKNLSKLKNSKDSDKFPVVTISAVDKGDGRNELQLRHSPSLDENAMRTKSTKLVRKNMSLFADQWIEFFVEATYAEAGTLKFQARNIETDELLVDFEAKDIDMWRGERREDFSRPKWGIYRSLKNKDSLRHEEEQARFADFSVRKVRLN